MGNRVNQATGRKGLGLTVGVLAVIALIAAAAAVYLATSSGPDNDTLARGTVSITTFVKTADGGREPRQGSGTIVDASRGLILTNAHVAQPQAKGLELTDDKGQPVLNPDEIELDITPGLDKPAEPKYFAKVVASDGYLDLAVLKITTTISGRRLTDADFADEQLVEIAMGDSDQVETSTDITVSGFPDVSGSRSATIVPGKIVGVVEDADLDTNRGWFNISASISPGNSGGLAANDDGEIIGVPTLNRTDDNGNKVGSIRPVNFAIPLITAAQNDKPYKSPFG